MRVIPVIDLMGGRVVRGVAGQRAEYRAVVSEIARDASPQEVARAFTSVFPFEEVYVADLDAIGGGKLDAQALMDIADCGLHPLVDAGIRDGASVRAIDEAVGGRAIDLVVGLESIDDAALLGPLCRAIGEDRAIFSLDLQDGRPITHVARWKEARPETIVADAVAAGFQRLIVLDLAYVGTRTGNSAAALCRQLRQEHPTLELTTGGGARNLEDLRALANAGCDAVLVASALHDGSLSGDNIRLVSG